jgi:uncharacterized RDD family membrane protein YckC
MKCSKCGYLGFESADRCRNCGYEFSLSAEYDLPDLVIRRDDEPRDLDDFTLVDAAIATPRPGGSATAAAVMAEPRPVVRPAPSAAMPLFAPGIDDDMPLITKPSPPRAPLSVRRSTPEMARPRSTTSPKTSTSDLGLDVEMLETQSVPRLFPSERAQVDVEPPAHYEDAGIARRLIAAALDSVILLAIDIVVIYFTMQICGISVAEFGLLPKAPLVVFLVVQNVGYLVAFTTGGQTLGKMAAGIKVVSEDADVALDLGCALKRTVVWLVLVFPAGLGFLSALFDRDHRGLHDLFAGTRVVRATA